MNDWGETTESRLAQVERRTRKIASGVARIIALLFAVGCWRMTKAWGWPGWVIWVAVVLVYLAAMSFAERELD